MHCDKERKCGAYRAEGYAACRDCDENQYTASREEKQPVIEPTNKPALEISDTQLTPPPEKEKYVKTTEEQAYDVVRQLVCNAFDCDDKRAFISAFKDEIARTKVIKRINDPTAKMDAKEVLEIYKAVATRFPRPKYDKEQTFNIIKATLEGVFGDGVMNQKVMWPDALKPGEVLREGLDVTFLNEYYEFVNSLPVLERKKLTNGLIHLLFKYILRKSGTTITQAEYDRVVAECKAYFSEYYQLRKKYNSKKIQSKKVAVAINESLAHQELGLPTLQIREK